MIDVPVAWIEAEHCDPMVQHCRHVVVNQLEGADTDHDQDRRLQEFEYRDHPDQSALRGLHLFPDDPTNQ
jgi:hypothetical protein